MARFDDIDIDDIDDSPVRKGSRRSNSSRSFTPETNIPQDDYNDNENDRFDTDEGYGDDGGGGYDMPMERHSDLLKDLTDFDAYLREVVNGWLGRYWDSEQGKYVSNKHVKPLMNERCATWCMTFMKTYARKNNIITHISRDEYVNIIEDIIEVVWLNIGTRFEEFGITTTGDIIRICTEIEHAAELVLMGAGGGKYGDLLRGTYAQNERPMGDNGMGGNMGGYGGNPMMGSKKQGMIQKAYNNTRSWLWGNQ